MTLTFNELLDVLQRRTNMLLTSGRYNPKYTDPKQIAAVREILDQLEAAIQGQHGELSVVEDQ